MDFVGLFVIACIALTAHIVEYTVLGLTVAALAGS
jgi:hypothetical protein